MVQEPGKANNLYDIMDLYDIIHEGDEEIKMDKPIQHGYTEDMIGLTVKDIYDDGKSVGIGFTNNSYIIIEAIDCDYSTVVISSDAHRDWPYNLGLMLEEEYYKIEEEEQKQWEKEEIANKLETYNSLKKELTKKGAL